MEVGSLAEDVDDAGPASGFFLFGLDWPLAGAGENVARTSFPWQPGPICWAVDSTATGIGRLRNWVLSTSYSMINAPAPHSRGQKIYFTISGHDRDSFPSPITRHGELLAEVYQRIMCFAGTRQLAWQRQRRRTSWDHHEVFVIFRVLDDQGSALMIPEMREI